MDECNTCTCTESGVSCTLMFCVGCETVLCEEGRMCVIEDGLPVCVLIEEENPCNLVDCADEKICIVDDEGCAQCIDDPCMTVRCGFGTICVARPDGTAHCVPPDTCEYDGMTYNEGDSFPSTDGCNTCSCSNGRVICTKRACIMDCATDVVCGAGFYCAKDTCDDEDRGLCADMPEICILIFDPVCGCDGVTYGNSCLAAAAGGNVLTTGECDNPSDDN